ncbi:hypothetical protein GCM10017559_82870 [Streptosporangium longisporum]|uniref:HTH araC/xylS-type domain-containing protein n=1 Tax=Streptosporangium longisporum TaxID=46187 RepID=A0ABP6LI87_9ACTN
MIGRVAAEHGFAHVATRYQRRRRRRPVSGRGSGPPNERGCSAPLRDAGMTKAEYGGPPGRDLVTCDKPAAPCLASRVAYGVECTPARCTRIETAVAGGAPLLSGRPAVHRPVGCATSATVRVELDGRPAAPGRRPAGLVPAVREAGFSRCPEVEWRSSRSGALNIEPLRLPDALPAGHARPRDRQRTALATARAYGAGHGPRTGGLTSVSGAAVHDLVG